DEVEIGPEAAGQRAGHEEERRAVEVVEVDVGNVPLGEAPAGIDDLSLVRQPDGGADRAVEPERGADTDGDGAESARDAFPRHEAGFTATITKRQASACASRRTTGARHAASS